MFTVWGYETSGDLPCLLSAADFDDMTGGRYAGDLRVGPALAAFVHGVDPLDDVFQGIRGKEILCLLNSAVEGSWPTWFSVPLASTITLSNRLATRSGAWVITSTIFPWQAISRRFSISSRAMMPSRPESGSSRMNRFGLATNSVEMDS
ncbi:MAG: hypothetical protein IKE55_13025, partial [Kiritimatiellae bacterium]|nr:hypothetical protein [Kiritimatiellia bacterium]